MNIKGKRYVREFANDEIKNHNCSEKRKLYIEAVLKHYEMGIIPTFEAIQMIVNSYYTDIEQYLERE